MTATIIEDTVEQVALKWLSGVGYSYLHGPITAPDPIARRLWVPLSVFTDPPNLKKLQSIGEWVIDEILAS